MEVFMIPTFIIKDVSERVWLQIQSRQREKEKALNVVFEIKTKDEETIFRQMNTQQVQNLVNTKMQLYDFPEEFYIEETGKPFPDDLYHTDLAKDLYAASEDKEDFITELFTSEYPGIDQRVIHNRDRDYGIVQFEPYEVMICNDNERTINGWEWPRSTFVKHITYTFTDTVYQITLDDGIEIYGVSIELEQNFVALEKNNDGTFSEIVKDGTLSTFTLDQLLDENEITDDYIQQIPNSKIRISLTKKTTEGSLIDYEGLWLDTLDTRDVGDQATRNFRINVLEEHDIDGAIDDLSDVPKQIALNMKLYNAISGDYMSEWLKEQLSELIKNGHITIKAAR